ncbi:transcriptional regulator with XRE-family HTH domain [Friedmanniella endophytica]|uniref:Transcriptional regulator with XRE-family HTH domain n=1 Tax=Microlunatus kandeliicorticis TaxID=1759536 RepID=A0A7W3P5Y0_9ACTN|nr:hypothetical protein [Microlunatus kandeliicorticis]MBA8794367.1 transcriptional regulator with XRE-family HTH domain [Microlunatus kandeliicorticis]
MAESGTVHRPSAAAVRVVAEPEAFGGWVLAAPFRAHLLHLLAATGLPIRVLAELAGASPRSVTRLLRGREGRPLTRIDPLLARRLYALTPRTVRETRELAVDPERGVAALARLLDHGWTTDDVADRLRLSRGLVGALRDGRRGMVSRWVEAHLVAAARMVESRPLGVGAPAAGTAAGVEHDRATRTAAVA